MDLISNMLTTIRNAKDVKHPSVRVAYSKVNFGIADVLKKEGFVEDVQIKSRGGKQWLIINLKYDKNGEAAINDVLMVSKPGKRIYTNRRVRQVRYGYGIAIISTPQGIITDREARKNKVGGEVLCKVW